MILSVATSTMQALTVVEPTSSPTENLAIFGERFSGLEEAA